MSTCFNPACGSRGGKGGGRGNTGQGKVVYDADPYEHRDVIKGGHLPRRTRIYGHDGDRDAIKGLLLGPGDGYNPSVVSIVGLGGLGKTTLARYVYNDDEVKGHFDSRAWFRVSERLEMAGLVMEVIRSTGGEGDPDAYEDIRVAVGGKRLLLVLDDVCEESIEDLIGFIRVSLGVTAKGSKIMVTTRSDRVATAMGGEGGAVHHLRGLSDEDCWKLFKPKAFHAGREETEQLERISREIVEEFQGVPLTAIAIGSLLRFESDRSVWANVRDSEIWELPEVANKTLLLGGTSAGIFTSFASSKAVSAEADADEGKDGGSAVTSSHGRKVFTDYSITGIPGDGRCLFRSVAHGARLRSGKPVPRESLQRELADELRARVADEFINRRAETEWMPITVYMHDESSGGLIAVAEYGQEYGKENPIRILYHGSVHYDALQIPAKRGPKSRL